MAKKVISCNRIRLHDNYWVAFDGNRGYKHFKVDSSPAKTIVFETNKLISYDRVVDVYNKRVLMDKKGKLFKKGK